MTPEDAELQYLDNSRKLPLYGVDLHTAVVCIGIFLIYKSCMAFLDFVWHSHSFMADFH